MDRIEKILAEPERHSIMVVGLERSGRALALMFRKLGAQVLATDRNPTLQGLEKLTEAGAKIHLGGDQVGIVRDADLVVLSPGVALRPLAAPIPSEAIRRGVPVVGEMELAYRILGRSTRRAPMMAVTGTNGKSTTTALCAHLLEQAGHRVFLGGNIGHPLSELVLSGEKVDWMVLEVSSFQLEHLTDPKHFIPKVGIWLNLTPDHLDRHITMRNYGRTKRRLFEGQGSDETGVFFLDDSNVNQQHEHLACTISGVSRNPARVPLVGALLIRKEITPNGWKEPFLINNPVLAGDHNAENAACATSAALAAGLSKEIIQKGLDTFKGLPHRMETVRIVGKVRYINDSKATNPDATAKALTSFTDPVVLIAGGRGKGMGYDMLREIVTKKVKNLILLGEDAGKLQQSLKGCTRIHMVSDMTEAVDLAKDLAKPGEVVLLSPACASFDMFKDYTERGRVFAQLVGGLESKS